MQFVFGPVPSRRLGSSLGVDPIPFKTCNWSCVYCQLGRTSPMCLSRSEFFPVDQIISELADALEDRTPREIDWITIVGSGEPTLHTGIGQLIRRIKAMTDLPLAVITNGSLLHLPKVRDDLLPADAVLPSLDAGSVDLYRRINRPPKTLTFDSLIEGLVALRKSYPGKLWIEVMLIKDINDTPQALADLASVLRRIAPDEVQLALPSRPPAEPWVEPSSDEGLRRAEQVLGDLVHIASPTEPMSDSIRCDNIAEAVASIITRHPMRETELASILPRYTSDQIEDALSRLAASGRARSVQRFGQRFWSAAGARFND